MNTKKVVHDHTIYIESNVKTSEYAEEINYSRERRADIQHQLQAKPNRLYLKQLGLTRVKTHGSGN